MCPMGYFKEEGEVKLKRLEIFVYKDTKIIKDKKEKAQI